jgi:hypothetical protein
MNIRKTIITATVALTMVAMIAPVAAGASTISDLQAQIAALTAQLNALSGSTTTTTTSGTVPAACVGVTFSRNLRVGMSGQDVMCFQVLLNTHGYVLAASGAGSPGHETMYFGLRTLASVRKWQVAQGWTPANQVGPLSRARFNAWLTGSTTNTTTTTTTTTNNNTTSTGPISAVLSSDTPASGAIIGGQATADLLHINFTGTGTVTSVTLQRTGISDQNLFTNIYLYDGNTRITDGYSFNVSGQIVINGLSIAVNGSHVISVKGDVEANASATEGSAIISLVGFTANGSTMTSSVMGNMMTVVSGSLASASLGTNTVLAASVNAGTTSYTFWSAPLQINTRAVWLKGANFRMIGSAPADAIQNIHLFIDGVDTGKVATISMINGSNYASFDLTGAPISLMTGSHTVDVRGDVQKGSNRNVQFSVQQAADLTIFDSQVGVNIAATNTGSTSFAANVAGLITINTGSATVNIDPAFQAMTNVAGGSTNVVIARYKVHAYGEDVKVNSLVVTPVLSTTGVVTAAGTTNVSGGVVTGTVTFTDASTGGLGYTAAPTVTIAQGTCEALPTATANIAGGKVTSITITGNGTSGCTAGAAITFGAPSFTTVGGLNNVTVYFNGSQVGSQQTAPAAATLAGLTYNLGSQMIAPAGQDSWLEIRADLQTTTNVNYTAGTVSADLAIGSSNAQGQTSLNTLNFPTAGVTGHTLSIQTGLLSVSTNTAYLNQTVSPNTAGVKIGSFIVQNQSTSESVRLTSLTVALGGSEAITNLSALRTSITSGSGSTPIQPAATNTFSVNETLAPGASKNIDIFADSSTQTGVNVIVTLTVQSIGVTSNVSSAGTAVTGQTITFNTGTLQTPTVLSATTTPQQFIGAGPSGITGGSRMTLNFVSSSAPSTVTELKFTVTGTNTVTNVCVGTVCAAPVSGVAYLTGLNLSVPNGGGGLNQDALISYSGVGTSGIVPGTTSAVALTYVKYTSGGSTTTITPSVTAPTMTMVGNVPLVTVPGTQVHGLTLGAVNKIGEVTIAADSRGNVKINSIGFAVGNTNITTFSISSPFISDNGGATAVSASGCGAIGATTSGVLCEFGASGDTFTSNGLATKSYTDFDGYTISAGSSKTFSLYGTVNGTQTASTSSYGVSTSLTDNATNSFNWDDASYAQFVADNSTASPSNGTNLTGVNIYGFPITNSYSVVQP